MDKQSTAPACPVERAGFTRVMLFAVVAAALANLAYPAQQRNRYDIKDALTYVCGTLVSSLFVLVALDLRALRRDADPNALAAPMAMTTWLPLTWLLGPLMLPLYVMARNKRGGSSSLVAALATTLLWLGVTGFVMYRLYLRYYW